MNPSCDFCHDSGIVELAGTSGKYSRGSAPCRWCDEGKRLYRFLTAKKQHPLTDYSDLSLAETPQPGYHAVPKAEALAEWDACTHDYRPTGLPQARPWNKDTIQLHTCHRCGKQEVEIRP